jgi:hypothetical protein
MAKIKRFIQGRCMGCMQEEELKQIKSSLEDVCSTYSVISTKNFPLRESSLPRQGLYASSLLGGHKAEANSAVAEGLGAAAAVRTPAFARKVGPATATAHAVRA